MGQADKQRSRDMHRVRIRKSEYPRKSKAKSRGRIRAQKQVGDPGNANNQV